MRKRTLLYILCASLAFLSIGCRSEEEIIRAHEEQQEAANQQEIVVRMDDPVEEKQILRVSGDGAILVPADLATVRLSIATEATTAEEAELAYNELLQAVISAITSMDVPRYECVADEMTVYPIQDQSENPPKTTGYSATTTLTVQVSNVAQVGNIVGGAIEAGAKEVQSVEFVLLDETNVYREALADAMVDAAEKAERIATTAGVTLLDISLIEEVSSSAEAANEATVSSEGEEITEDPLESHELLVFAQVMVEYWVEAAPDQTAPHV